MLDTEFFIQLAVEIARTLLVEESSDHVRLLIRKIRRPRGMQQIRREVHLKARRRLWSRLSP